MKKILGLDLGTTSIGWAFVHEAENDSEQSEIKKLGVRIIPLSADESSDFEKGKSITTNASRTEMRGARRNLQRFKQRRENLIKILKLNHLIDEETVLAEVGNAKTFETLALRAKAASEEISLSDLSRILLYINKKRGYKSSRKVNKDDDGSAVDGMAVAMTLYHDKLTPGQYCLSLLKSGKRSVPDFYRSDLQAEFDKVWAMQKQFHPLIFTDEFYTTLQNKGLQEARKTFYATHKIETAENKGTRDEKRIQAYQWRSLAPDKEISLSEAASVIAEISGNINQSSGYLGNISDRSKELYFNKQTVGQYLYAQIQASPHTRLKGQVFYRLDYLNEFEKIWDTQKQFHPSLTDQLREEIRDTIIFYQRKLKSQKGLISFCEFESRQKTIQKDGKPILKTIGSRVAPKSSPLFQEFKIWQILANVQLMQKSSRDKRFLTQEEKEILFEELNVTEKLLKSEVLKLLVDKPAAWDLNYSQLEGNRTNHALYGAYQKMFEDEGHDTDFSRLTAKERTNILHEFFGAFGIDNSILRFDALLDDKAFEQQTSYRLWHLLHSYEEDDSISGNERLYKQLEDKYGFKREYAQILAKTSLQDDYGSLSTKAMRKIMPYIYEQNFSDACKQAGYNHSASVTKDENLKRSLKDHLDILPKNSLRNPVVEKILNQMINVINAIIDDPSLGKPDEIRIELARELKGSAKERAEATEGINKAKGEHEKYRKDLTEVFGIKNPTRNDLIRYKLYLELEPNGYKTLYTGTYIAREKLFSKEFDIEHIIPKAKLFDDSFSNKTIEARQANIAKADTTAIEYVTTLGAEAEIQFKTKVESLYKDKKISKAKYLKLLKTSDEIGEGFIDRDLRETQYIAKKAKDMLMEICRTVVSSTGSITSRLREDWGLINIMQDLNIDKYRSLGLTEHIETKDGNSKERITDWTKRNDHRHHAMDALTVAFTKHSHIQYLNNLNARKDIQHKKHPIIANIETKETERDENGKRVFKQPMTSFRIEAKRHLEQTLISFKAKNKVVTNNKNRISNKSKSQQTLTPRGQLHNDTFYAKSQEYVLKQIKIGTGCDAEQLAKVAKKIYREALLARLEQYGGDPKKAFGGKNSMTKNPVLYGEGLQVPERVAIVSLDDRYTIRKEISVDLRIDKVIDKGIRNILKKRLEEYGGNPKEAFVDLEKNPIWLNQEKGIAIKRVAITGMNELESLHCKRDIRGNEILDKDGKKIASDFVSTNNNHHVAIYRDEKGKLQEEVVSFFEAVARVNAGLPVINTLHEKGWEFLFTMKKNEMFVFPSPTFDPQKIDLLNPENSRIISPHLFRVQTISTKNYLFNHHLETQAANKDSLKNKSLSKHTYHSIRTPENLKNIIKVRINHLGLIVEIGE